LTHQYRFDGKASGLSTSDFTTDLKLLCDPPVVSKIRFLSFAYRRGRSSLTDSRKYHASSPNSNAAASPASGSTSGFSPGIESTVG
jgi:hypothetical protein